MIENKRDRTPRDVLAQTIDYAAWVRTLTFDEVETIYARYRAARSEEAVDLADDFEAHFGEPLETLAEVPRMVVVAAHLDDSTERMIDFLADSFDVPVNAVLFQPFSGGLIGRTWLRPDVEPPRSAGKRSASSAAKREQSQKFWEQWLPIARPVLAEITLPQNGPKAVWLKRSITAGIPVKIQMWVGSTDAYAEIQFDDDEAEVNAQMLEVMQRRRAQVEEAFGEPLDWRGHDSHDLLTKRTKIVGPKIDVGEPTKPTQEGMEKLADSARRLIDAVRPHLKEVYDEASEVVSPLSAPNADGTAPPEELLAVDVPDR